VTFSSADPVAKGGVDVHIPEARNQYFPVAATTFAARGIRRSALLPARRCAGRRVTTVMSVCVGPPATSITLTE